MAFTRLIPAGLTLSAIVLLNSCGTYSEGDIVLNSGQKHLLEGDWKGARTLFERALASYTSQNDRLGVARATGNIGHTYLGEDDYVSALAYTEKAVGILKQLDQTSPSVLFSYGMALTNRAALLFNLGDLGEAERLLRDAQRIQADLWRRIKWNPLSPIDGTSAGHFTNLVHYNLGVLHRITGDFKGGVAGLLAVFEQGLVQDRDMARVELALTSMAAGNLPEARSWLEKADRFGDRPENQKIQRRLTPRLRLVQARLFLKLGSPAEAMSSLNKVDYGSLAPELQAVFHTLKGECLASRGSDVESIQEYRTARDRLASVLERIPESTRQLFMARTVLGFRRIDIYSRITTSGSTERRQN